MKERTNIDNTLRALDSRGRYQLMQVIVINLGQLAAAYQLLDNVFIGRDVENEVCAAPNRTSRGLYNTGNLDSNSSFVKYEECSITVSDDNFTHDFHRSPCVYGYNYSYPSKLSFRTEFDLVCDLKLLGGLVQTLLILGQGVGAVLAAILSDRYGRRKALIGSQAGLLVIGLATGLSPNYPVLALLKFLVGGCQQGVVTTSATMTIELFAFEHRSLQLLICNLLAGLGSTSLALVAYLMRAQSWRYLQYALSSISLPICLVQLWYLDESLRWLVANGRKHAVVRVLERAARVNRKDLNLVLQSLHHSDTESKYGATTSPRDLASSHLNPETSDSTEALIPKDDIAVSKCETESSALEEVYSSTESSSALADVGTTLGAKRADKNSILDLFRHRRMFCYAAICWLAWFTTAFAYFALYLTSTSLYGNRFLNYFLTAAMELPPVILFYFIIDRYGRKTSTRASFVLAAVGLISSGVLRMYTENSTLGALSVACAMLGMVGASGMFALLFLYTVEIFPTNLRNQSLGVASFAGRLGGMLAPFMSELGDVASWAPGALIGSLCFLVVILFRFLPETKGKELPHTIEETESLTRGGRSSHSD